MPKVKSKSKKTSKFYLLAGITVTFLIIAKLAYNSLIQPAGINELTATVSKYPAPTRIGIPRPTGGDTCYYMDVQCVQAPCNPVLVCPNPTTKPVPSGPVSTPRPIPSMVSTPMPLPSINPSLSGVASFVSKGSCGSNHFLTISFSCRDGRMKEISNNVCTDVFTALNQAEVACVSAGNGGITK